MRRPGTVTHIFAAAGFDVVILDRQHTANDWTEIEQLCWRRPRCTPPRYLIDLPA